MNKPEYRSPYGMTWKQHLVLLSLFVFAGMGIYCIAMMASDYLFKVLG